jgi:hypothetical protein
MNWFNIPLWIKGLLLFRKMDRMIICPTTQNLLAPCRWVAWDLQTPLSLYPLLLESNAQVTKQDIGTGNQNEEEQQQYALGLLWDQSFKDYLLQYSTLPIFS